ncbi:MAG: ribosome silencing factor [Candidatus Hydrogenedentota bacterium]
MAKLVKKQDKDFKDYLPNAIRIADILEGFKAKNIKAFDVTEHTIMTDCILMCSGTSDPQLKAMFNGVKRGMKEVGAPLYHSEGEIGGNWLLLDYGTIFVHIFREEAYDFYDLEGFWADAESVDLELDED